MPHSFTSIATFTEAIARVLAKYQVDSGDLFEHVGLSREPFRDPDARVKLVDMNKIWAEAERRTKNPCIGFEVGMGLHATNFHAVGYAWLGQQMCFDRGGDFGPVRLARLQGLAVEGDIEFLDESDPLELLGLTKFLVQEDF